MIIKVRSIFPESQIGVTQSWRYFDNVEGVHHTLYEDGEALFAESAQWGVPEDVQTLRFKNPNPRPAVAPMVFIAFTSEVTGPVHLFCDTECYLLNDNGKTIERLY